MKLILDTCKILDTYPTGSLEKSLVFNKRLRTSLFLQSLKNFNKKTSPGITDSISGLFKTLLIII